MSNIYSANDSTVLVDGNAIEGVKSLSYRIVTEREDIRAVGSRERVDVNFGLRTVQGELVVQSTSPELDKHLEAQSKTQIVGNLKKGEAKRSCAFDDCYVESKSMGMESGGIAISTYRFSAVRVREE